MDSVLNVRNFPILAAIESNVFASVRLLCVFGCNGKEVIYVTNDDNVYAFGRNRFGGLGLGHLLDVESPQLNPYLSGNRLANIFCGYEHWTAVTASGLCYSWGNNDFGQLGINSDDSTATPHLIEELANERVVEMCCGAAHTLALTADGRVFSWGSNKCGQLGTAVKGNVLTPMKISINQKVMSISCGKNHCIALTVGGRVYVWGLNSYGQLGRESISGIYTPFPKKLWEIATNDISKAICGPNYSILLSSDGFVYTFGDNSVGQIGDGSTQKQVTPFKVSEDIKFKDIVANKEEDLTVAVSDDNRFYMWGLADNRRHLAPKEITDCSGLSVFDIYAIYAKTKVTYKTVLINEELKSWERISDNSVSDSEESNSKCISNLMLSLKSSMDELSPNLRTLDSVMDLKNLPILYTTLIDERVRNSIRLIRVFGNRGCKVIFITNADKAYTFGLNRDGSLALTTEEERIRKPEFSRSLSDKQLVDITSGFEHCIGLTADGRCYAWGMNQFGQLGIGGTQIQRSAQLIQELTDVTVIQISCGSYHSLALTSDGDLFSWGHNTFAQLGDRTYNSRDVPTQVMIREKVVSISCGLNHSIGLTIDGQVYVWGNNSYGQLGRNPDEEICNRLKPMCNRPFPLTFVEPVVITKAICGPNHSLLLSIDGDIYSFGLNSEGQVGNGTTENQCTPHKLNKNIKIKDIVCHSDNELSIAVSVSDKCFIWGQVYGQNKRLLSPQFIPDSPERMDDIYVKNSCNKVMFRSLVVNSLDQISKSGLNFAKLEELVFEKNLKQYSNDGLNHQISEAFRNLDTNDSQSSESKTFDDILEIKHIPSLESNLKDENVRKAIKLLCVFGKNGSEVIYATYEDLVYCFGANESGCLGLGCDSKKIRTPTLNGLLSNKGLTDIRCGFKHCVGLTESGQCYGWGHNKYGQLGFGNNKLFTSPTIIVGLLDKKIIQISCGAYHSLALSISGKVYSWGQNTLGQLGDCSYKDSWSPILVTTKHPIVSISCGWNHSTAIADIGIVYMWGHNQFGQLGRQREHDYRPEQKQWIANRPLLNHFFKNIQFKRAVCGANYTLLLTTDGFVYGFGDNTNGQIGKGSLGAQHIPIRINDEIRFSEIVAHFSNDLSIGVSAENRFYVWGLAFEKQNLTPKLIPESGEESLFNVYAKYAVNKVTFKTIVVNQKGNQLNKTLIDSESEEIYQSFEDSNLYYSDDSEEEEDINYFKDKTPILQDSKSLVSVPKTASEVSTVCDTLSVRSSIRASKSSNSLQNSLIQSFNNPNNSDLKFIVEEKAIHCHKTILMIRNQKFSDLITRDMSQGIKEVRIDGHKYEPFHAFLKYLYGIESEFNDRTVFELKSMAETFGETELRDECMQYIANMRITPDLSNVCSLYEKAVVEGLTDLTKTCVEFAANNWKTVVKSAEFLAMDDSLSKRLIVSIFEM